MTTLSHRPRDVVRLTGIRIFPIKSLPGVLLEESAFCPNGALQSDRRWALVDQDNVFVNAKRTARIHHLQAEFAPDLATVNLSTLSQPAETLAVRGDRSKLEQYLSDFFGFSIRVVEHPGGGFPDDTEAPGPTLITTATLEAVARWFPTLSVDNVRQRFRANLEFDAAEAFWEDRLYGPAGSTVKFRIRDATLAGTNPCQRCVVPTRDPATGEIYPRFTPEFARHRELSLPAWAEVSRFNHFYRLAVNSRGIDCPPHARIRLGDELVIDNQSE